MTALLAALTRIDVANYISTLFSVYIVLIFIRIIMSYFQRIPYYRMLDVALGFVRDVTDPYLNLFRRYIPPVRLGGAAIDLSPMIGIFLLYILRSLIVSAILGR